MPEVSGVRHRMIKVGDVSVHIAEIGEGKPVLLLHSFPQHWFEWREVLQLLKNRYHLIAVDLPGFGWSEASVRGYSTTKRAQDVLAIIAALELPQVDLIGHGWGAIVGFEVCLQAPEKIAHFLSISAAHPWLSRSVAMRNAWRQWHTVFWEYPFIGRTVLARMPAITERIMRHWSVQKSTPAVTALREYTLSYRNSSAAYAGEKLNWEYVLHDIPGLLLAKASKRHLTVPTVLLVGNKDVVIPPAMAEGGQLNADNLRWVVVEDAGQLLPEEKPEAVAQEARRLFE